MKLAVRIFALGVRQFLYSDQGKKLQIPQCASIMNLHGYGREHVTFASPYPPQTGIRKGGTEASQSPFPKLGERFRVKANATNTCYVPCLRPAIEKVITTKLTGLN